MTGTLELLTAAEARALTDQIKVAVEGTWQLVQRAYVSRAWEALGYPSWDDYCTREFGTSRLRLPREERPEVVSSLREIGMSQRAIAAATGLSKGTVQNELKAGAQNRAPAPGNVTDLRDYRENRRPADELDGKDSDLEPEPSPAPAPAPSKRVTGTDGKRYAAKSAARTAPRLPLPGQFLNAAKELSRAIHKIERLSDDDRFRANRCAISDQCVPQIRRAVEVLQDLLDELGEDDGDPD
jgi:hypothetical protein